MATTPNIPAPASTPPPAQPSGSIYSQLSSLTSGVADQLDKQDSPAEPSQAAEPVSEPPAPVADTPPAQAETSVTSADTTAQPAAANPYETDEASDIPQASLDAILQTPRGREIYQGYKAMRELGQPMGPDGQGGIGHIPTTGQIRDYYLAYRDRRMMDMDLSSGNAQQVGRYLGYVFDPARGEANFTIASQLAPTLAQNPELYAAAMEPFLSHYLESILSRYKESKGYLNNAADEEADALWLAAQVLHKDLNDKYMDPIPAPARRNGTSSESESLARERQEISAQRAELDRMRGQQAQAQRGAWTNAYTNEVAKALFTELDLALEPLKKAYSAAPNLYNAARRQFHDEVVAAVNGNGPAMELFNVSAQEAMRNMSPQSAQALARQFLNIAVPEIRGRRKKFLEGAGAVAQRQSDARHAELATIDSNRGGGGQGPAPGPSTNGPPMEKGKNETQADFLKRMISAATAGVPRQFR